MMLDDDAASSVTLLITDFLGQHLQDKPPIFNADLLNETQTQKNETDLMETGCSTLSHADLRVTAETTERRVKFCQEV